MYIFQVSVTLKSWHYTWYYTPNTSNNNFWVFIQFPQNFYSCARKKKAKRGCGKFNLTYVQDWEIESFYECYQESVLIIKMWRSQILNNNKK